MNEMEMHEHNKMLANIKRNKPLNPNVIVHYNKNSDVRVYALC